MSKRARGARARKREPRPPAAHLIWRARVPKTRARSYLVMYLVVSCGTQDAAPVSAPTTRPRAIAPWPGGVRGHAIRPANRGRVAGLFTRGARSDGGACSCRGGATHPFLPFFAVVEARVHRPVVRHHVDLFVAHGGRGSVTCVCLRGAPRLAKKHALFRRGEVHRKAARARPRWRSRATSWCVCVVERWARAEGEWRRQNVDVRSRRPASV